MDSVTGHCASKECSLQLILSLLLTGGSRNAIYGKVARNVSAFTQKTVPFSWHDTTAGNARAREITFLIFSYVSANATVDFPRTVLQSQSFGKPQFLSVLKVSASVFHACTFRSNSAQDHAIAKEQTFQKNPSRLYLFCERINDHLRPANTPFLSSS